MKNFFEFQRQARQKSNSVLLVFGLFLIVLLFIYNFLIYHGIIFVFSDDQAPVTGLNGLIEGEFQKFQIIALGIFVLGFLGTYILQLHKYKSNPLSIVADLHGRQINYSQPNLKMQERQLLNIVEEMCIAAGIPVVPVYILTQESSINAFTAGHDLKTAYIAMTEGALKNLSRDEIQAVVAHEVGHIVSADVSVNAVLFSCIAALTFLMTLGLQLLRSMRHTRSSKNDGRGPILILAIILLVVGYMGAITAQILQSLFSRRREYLADSLGVQFSRNPSALARALAKIRDIYSGYIAEAKVVNIAHMCIASPLNAGFFSGLWASHPPINSRIKLLDPKYLDSNYSLQKNIEDEKKQNLNVIPTKIEAKAIKNGLLTNQPLMSEVLSKMLIDQMDALKIKQVLHDPMDFKYSVWSLFVASDKHIQAKQVAMLKQLYLENFDENKLYLAIDTIENTNHLSTSILSIATPSIKGLETNAKKRFLQSLHDIAFADGNLSAFEMISMASLVVMCDDVQIKDRINHAKVKKLLAAFASIPNKSIDMKKLSLDKAIQIFYGSSEDKDAEYLKLQFTYDELVLWLHSIRKSSIYFKQLITKAILSSIKHDDEFTLQEIEAFRIFSMAIGIPSPPIEL